MFLIAIADSKKNSIMAHFTKVVSPLALMSPPKEGTMLICRVRLVWPPVCVAWRFVRVLWGKCFIFSILFYNTILQYYSTSWHF